MFLKIGDYAGDNYGEFVNVPKVQAAQVAGQELKVFLVGSTAPFVVRHIDVRRARASYKKVLKNLRYRGEEAFEFAGVSFVRPVEIVSLRTTQVPGVLEDKEKTPCVWPALVFNLSGDKSFTVEGRSFSEFDKKVIAFISKLSLE